MNFREIVIDAGAKSRAGIKKSAITEKDVIVVILPICK
jgi:hypothetical protein